jgi:hypothetical protein
MKTISYHTEDKSGWAEGPWQSEPDKMQWQDEATGLPCLLLRGPMGALCGYVGIPPEHPAYGLHYDGITKLEAEERHTRWRSAWTKAREAEQEGLPVGVSPLEVFSDNSGPSPEPKGVGVRVSEIEVHGGLTFAGGCQHGDDPSKRICHLPDEGEPDDLWWFGFDCAHAWDFMPGYHARTRNRGFPFESDQRPEDVYRDVAYVKAECESLARQLAAISQP